MERLDETGIRQVAQFILKHVAVKIVSYEFILEHLFGCDAHSHLPGKLFARPEALLIWTQELTAYSSRHHPLMKWEDMKSEDLQYKFWTFVADPYRGPLSKLGLFPKQSLQYLEWLVEQIPLQDIPMSFLTALFRRIRSEDFLPYAEASQQEGLKRLAAYHAASLPWERTFWLDYLNSTEPEPHLKEMFEKVQPWRRGRRLDVVNEETLRWAFAGLDYPDALPFEWGDWGFEGQFYGEKAPTVAALIVNRPFTASVRIQGSDRSTSVEFLPSRSEADIGFGHVAELTYHMMGFRDVIYPISAEGFLESQSVQIYRMIAEGRLVGMLFLVSIVSPEENTYRHLAVHLMPRSLWNADMDSLLEAIEGPLSQIAEEEGYDTLLLHEHDGDTSKELLLHAGPLKEAMRRRYSNGDGWPDPDGGGGYGLVGFRNNRYSRDIFYDLAADNLIFLVISSPLTT